MKDPAPYLKEIGTELSCAMGGGLQARIDARLSTRVNHETFFFSMPAAKRKFRRNPVKYCGLLTDPVTKVRFQPNKKSPRQDWNGRPYFFSSAESAARFAVDPEMYAEPMGRMVPKPQDAEAEKDAGARDAGGAP